MVRWTGIDAAILSCLNKPVMSVEAVKKEMAHRKPGKSVVYGFSLGWSGDTVWGDSRGVFGSRVDGFKRLVDDTLAAKPTVLVIAYGQNEAFAGDIDLADFRYGLKKPLDALAPSQARVVLVAPPKSRSVPPPLPPVDPYNRQLDRRTVRLAGRQADPSYADDYPRSGSRCAQFDL